MEKQCPSKFWSIVGGSLKTYSFLVVPCGCIALLLYFQTHYWDKESFKYPLGTWVYIAFGLASPLIALPIVWISFIKNSGHRKNDPFRFSRTQYRYFNFPSTQFPNLSEVLMKLGYYILTEQIEEGRVYLEAGRVLSKKPLPHQKEKHQTPFKIEFDGARKGSSWNITIKAYPLGSMVVADFKNTIYDSLEEAIDELGWRAYLI